MKTGRRGAKFDSMSPKEAEFRPANFASDVGGGFPVKIEDVSDEKVSFGKLSMAYAGGPGVMPYRLWCGAANCSKDISFRRCCLGSGFGFVVLSISS